LRIRRGDWVSSTVFQMFIQKGNRLVPRVHRSCGVIHWRQLDIEAVFDVSVDHKIKLPVIISRDSLHRQGVFDKVFMRVAISLECQDWNSQFSYQIWSLVYAIIDDGRTESVLVGTRREICCEETTEGITDDSNSVWINPWLKPQTGETLRRMLFEAVKPPRIAEDRTRCPLSVAHCSGNIAFLRQLLGDGIRASRNRRTSRWQHQYRRKRPRCFWIENRPCYLNVSRARTSPILL